MNGKKFLYFLDWIILLYHHPRSSVSSTMMGLFIGAGFGLTILLNPMNALLGFGLWLAIMYYIYKRHQTLN